MRVYHEDVVWGCSMGMLHEDVALWSVGPCADSEVATVSNPIPIEVFDPANPVYDTYLTIQPYVIARHARSLAMRVEGVYGGVMDLVESQQDVRRSSIHGHGLVAGMTMAMSRTMVMTKAIAMTIGSW